MHTGRVLIIGPGLPADREPQGITEAWVVEHWLVQMVLWRKSNMADVCRRKAIGVKFLGGKTDGSVEESIWPTFVGGKQMVLGRKSKMADVCRRNPVKPSSRQGRVKIKAMTRQG